MDVPFTSEFFNLNFLDFSKTVASRKSEFVAHMHNSHINGRTVKCYVCNLEFSGRERARDHLKKEHLDSDCGEPGRKILIILLDPLKFPFFFLIRLRSKFQQLEQVQLQI